MVFPPLGHKVTNLFLILLKKHSTIVSLCAIFFFLWEGLFFVVQDLKDTPRNLCWMLVFSPPCPDQKTLAADLRSSVWQFDKTDFKEIWHYWKKNRQHLSHLPMGSYLAFQGLSQEYDFTLRQKDVQEVKIHDTCSQFLFSQQILCVMLRISCRSFAAWPSMPVGWKEQYCSFACPHLFCKISEARHQ